MTGKPRMMSHDDLVRTAANAAAATDRKMRGFAERFPKAIDCLLKLPHWRGAHTNDSSFYCGWALGAFVTAGHSFAAVYHLMRTAFYLEANVLMRHLAEILVQVVYFASRREKAEQHFIFATAPQEHPTGSALPKRNTVQFKQMFDAVAPGFYEHQYRLASEFAHGGVGGVYLRSKLADRTFLLGCHYDDRNFGFASNHAVTMIYGFIRRFPNAFPQWDVQAGTEDYSAALRSLDEILVAQWREFPESRSWLTTVSRLIGWDTPNATDA